MTDAERFWSKVNKNGPIHPVLGTCCWLCAAGADPHYGVFSYHGVNVGAHRFAFFLKHGRWPKPCCCHKCDAQLCVNDDHLFEGTYADNTQDAMSKGRWAPNWNKGKKMAESWRLKVIASKTGVPRPRCAVEASAAKRRGIKHPIGCSHCSAIKGNKYRSMAALKTEKRQ